MEINNIVNNFRNYMLSSWDSFMIFSNNLSKIELEERINDWLQANWEILVESSIVGIDEYLEVYGYGADCNGDSSRICFPEKLPTHRIVCRALSSKPVMDMISQEMKLLTNDMTFYGFVNWEMNYFNIAPPFDNVLLEGKMGKIVTHTKNIYFDLETVNSKIA